MTIAKITPAALLLLGAIAQQAAAYCNCSMCQYIRRHGVQAWDELMSGRVAQPKAIELVASPPEAIRTMLDELDLSEHDLLYDLGCGDGRILIEAVRRYRCQAVGIEIDPHMAERARYRVRQAEASRTIPRNRITIVTGDARKFRLDQPTAVTMYLFPSLMAELVPKLPGGIRIASYAHEIPGHRNRRVAVDGAESVYCVDLRPVDYVMEPVLSR